MADGTTMRVRASRPFDSGICSGVTMSTPSAARLLAASRLSRPAPDLFKSGQWVTLQKLT
jgi:hypothetical protein